ncbi:MAG: alanine--glyoxylate aminotransferase family protein [Candidatus Latescibacterota bacterium]|nr:MAG: alanine--glyoxylate aminotransferase family protein [Candidatus Latescibacterota bacterium]
MNINPFDPPMRVLMGPGPSDVHPRILEAMARPTIGHLDPEFIRMMDEIKSLVQYAFQTRNDMTMVVSGPGSVGMETCFVNLVEPGDKVVVCQNGVFGGRMKENVERCGGVAVMVEDEWGRAIDPNKLDDALSANSDAKIVAFVHAETSTGALSDAETVARVARDHDCLTIMDAVTSLGGCPVKIDEWKIDAVYSGSQKCLSCTPGLAPISFNDRAMDVVTSRSKKIQSWFMDLTLVLGYWGSHTKRAYHHTAPVNALYGLHEALLILWEEGVENAWARHLDNHYRLRDGLGGLGLALLVSEDQRIPQLNAVKIPGDVEDAEVRSLLLNDFGLEIGAGLGPLAGKIWRIGLMGYSSRMRNVVFCLNALSEVLGR